MQDMIHSVDPSRLVQKAKNNWFSHRRRQGATVDFSNTQKHAYNYFFMRVCVCVRDKTFKILFGIYEIVRRLVNCLKQVGGSLIQQIFTLKINLFIFLKLIIYK